MGKWMPKMKNIGKKQLAALFAGKKGLDSIKPFFGKAKPAFYKLPGNNIIAFGELADSNWLKRYLKVAKFDALENTFKPLAKATIELRPTDVYIWDLDSTPTARPAGKIGINVFRLFLNYAINLAKKESREKISIIADNEKLQEYYGRFGFKFDSRLNGTLTIKI